MTDARTVFIPADPAAHREALREMNLEYVAWVSDQMSSAFGVSVADLVGMPLAAYVEGAIDKVCGDPPPRGAFYLVERDGTLAAMGGLRRVRDGIAEVKRFYVRPSHRGHGLGESLMQRVVADAAAFGYRTLYLDTAPFMTAAHRLYEAAGFTDRGPYPEAEVPAAMHAVWRFMERDVAGR
jgi:GNAT superfamily N-acetyltransferase